MFKRDRQTQWRRNRRKRVAVDEEESKMFGIITMDTDRTCI